MIDRNFRDILERHGILDPGHLSSGSDDVDLLVDAVHDFEREHPVPVSNKVCPVCGSQESDQPTIFRDGKGCSDLCRKVHRGDMKPGRRKLLLKNLTKK